MSCPNCKREIAENEITWPDALGREMCQECWEKHCAVSWLKMLEVWEVLRNVAKIVKSKTKKGEGDDIKGH